MNRIPVTLIDGTNFAERVVPPGPVPAEGPVTKKISEPPSDPILHDLVEVNSRAMGDKRKYGLQLISQLVALHKEIAAFRAEIMDEGEKDLAQRWEDAKLACRNAQCEIDNTKGRITELQREINRLNQTMLGPALANRQTAQDERANVSRFAPAKEVQKLDAAIIKANVEVEKAQKEVAVLQQEINGIVHVTLPRLGEKFQKLSTEEKRICGMVTGQVFADETTGLPMLPEL